MLKVSLFNMKKFPHFSIERFLICLLSFECKNCQFIMWEYIVLYYVQYISNWLTLLKNNKGNDNICHDILAFNFQKFLNTSWTYC